MRAKRVSKSEQFQLILECRQSGLTDVQWCRENNIKPSTFYNWVSRMRDGKPQDNSAAKTENVEATMEIIIGNASLRISNRADPILLSCLLKAMGGSF